MTTYNVCGFRKGKVAIPHTHTDSTHIENRHCNVSNNVKILAFAWHTSSQQCAHNMLGMPFTWASQDKTCIHLRLLRGKPFLVGILRPFGWSSFLRSLRPFAHSWTRARSPHPGTYLLFATRCGTCTFVGSK